MLAYLQDQFLHIVQSVIGLWLSFVSLPFWIVCAIVLILGIFAVILRRA